jgi:FtsH-binding integral membrane protein
MDMLKKLVSLEEKRVSTLMVSMLITLVFSLLMYWCRGDISSNLVNVLGALIAGVVGVSIANVVNSVLGKPQSQISSDNSEKDLSGPQKGRR